MPPATSTRWCPTPEQLMILEEMYKSGLRTPNASQIQKITAHLSFYGKIEGKNVFYWFQNHKARDRQKLRRNMHAAHNHNYNNFKGFSSMHPYNCFGLNQPSGFDNPLAHEYLHQVGAEAATHAEITNYCKWNLDTPPEIQKQQSIGVGAEAATHAEITNYCKWNLDTPPEIQKQQNIGVRTNDDDWMMMMLKEACSTSYCSCKSTKVPLKTLDLFPIKSPTSVKENEEQQQQHDCTTYNFRANKNVTSSSMMMMSLDIMSTSSSSSLNHN